MSRPALPDLELNAMRPAARTSLDAVTVRAHARLHLGFLDPSGTLGRRFGSLGLIIDAPRLCVTLCPADEDELSAREGHAELPRLARHLQALRQATGCTQALRVELVEALPAHAGFGSGTQLALALGRAFAELHGIPLDTAALVRLLGRGARSGVGIAGFDSGGFIVDGGPCADGAAAPVLARVDVPPAWRMLLIEDLAAQGLHGPQEAQVIARLAPFPAAGAAEICHQVLMRLLPALAEHQFEPFALGLTRIQQLIGEHFAPAQGGSTYTSPQVGRALRSVVAHRPAGIGQSSWGPTGFAVLPSQAAAEAALQGLQAAGLIGGPASTLRVRIVSGCNRGADVLRGSLPPD